jgi:hypothetical protein
MGHVLVSTEFAQTVLAPAVMTAATGTAGYLGGIPAMWIIMASSITFAVIVMGLLFISIYRERESAEGKLRFTSTVFQYDLIPFKPNRPQRRAAGQQYGVKAIILEPSIRHIENGQLGVEVFNGGTFPLSVILEAADTAIENKTPPRVQYPKPASLLLPGLPARICDERISLNSMECRRLEGRCYMSIRYGRPGKERYRLDLRLKKVDIHLQPNGMYAGNYTEWEGLTPSGST